MANWEPASSMPENYAVDVIIRSKFNPSYRRRATSLIEIDWEATARNIAMDYTTVDFDGVTYYIRSC